MILSCTKYIWYQGLYTVDVDFIAEYESGHYIDQLWLFPCHKEFLNWSLIKSVGWNPTRYKSKRYIYVTEGGLLWGRGGACMECVVRVGCMQQNVIRSQAPCRWANGSWKLARDLNPESPDILYSCCKKTHHMICKTLIISYWQIFILMRYWPPQLIKDPVTNLNNSKL